MLTKHHCIYIDFPMLLDTNSCIRSIVKWLRAVSVASQPWIVQVLLLQVSCRLHLICYATFRAVLHVLGSRPAVSFLSWPSSLRIRKASAKVWWPLPVWWESTSTLSEQGVVADSIAQAVSSVVIVVICDKHDSRTKTKCKQGVLLLPLRYVA